VEAEEAGEEVDEEEVWDEVVGGEAAYGPSCM
jgi:hypothetical protein